MGSSQTRARTRVPCIGRWILNHCTTMEVPGTDFLKVVFMGREMPPSSILRMCNPRQNTAWVTHHLNWPETLPVLTQKVPCPEETPQAKRDGWSSSPSRGHRVSPYHSAAFWWEWVWQALLLSTHFGFLSISSQEGGLHFSVPLKLGDVMWLAQSNKTWMEEMLVTCG